MRPRTIARLLVANVAAVTACAPEPAPSCEPLLQGVPIVANAEAPDGQRTFRLEQLWRRAGTREGEELGHPITVVAAPDGRIAIPDFQLAEVRIVDADGTWQGAATRAGEGPHETAQPVAAAWAGRTLRVYDILNAKVVAVGADGSPAGNDIAVDPAFAASVLGRGEMLGAALQPSGAPVLLTETEVTRPGGAFTDRRRGLVLRLQPGTARVDTLASPVYPLVFAPGWGEARMPGWPRPVAAVGGGTLAVAAADGTYRILLYDDDGRPVRQVCRSVPPLPLSERELGADTGPELAALAQAFHAGERPDRPAAIGRVVVTTEGGLWVEQMRPARFGAPNEALWGVPGATLDVFDDAGHFTGQVHPPANARIQAVSGDRAWAFETGSMDEVWLVAYRILTE